MKKFSKFLEEMVETSETLISETSNVSDINANLSLLIDVEYANIYVALEQIKNVLSHYDITLPSSINIIVSNWGNEVFKLENCDCYLFLTYIRNSNGYYTVSSSLVNDEELDTLLGESELFEENEELDYYCISPALLIRLMEYSRESIKDDLEIHKIADNFNRINKEEKIFTSDDYKSLLK
jgi:hypothetical protein